MSVLFRALTQLADDFSSEEYYPQRVFDNLKNETANSDASSKNQTFQAGMVLKRGKEIQFFPER